MPIVSVRSLRKAFRLPIRQIGLWNQIRSLVTRPSSLFHALNDLSFDIEEGETVGYLGPNGAGKSTTLKILAGILVPDSGDVRIFGRVPWKHRIATVSQIGAIFGQRTQLWWDLPVIDSFQLIRSIYRLTPENYRETLEDLVTSLDLEPLLEIPVRLLSLGQRMRCELAAALLHSPRLLLLDEPTIGLDDRTKLAVRRQILRACQEQQVTLLLTTHDLRDVEALCSRIIKLTDGQISYDGPLESQPELILQ